MYACICHAVSTDTVEYAVLAGADTIEQVGHVTGAGTGCGSCYEVLDSVIERVGCPLMALRAAS